MSEKIKEDRCQECKFHKNKPSRCIPTGRYVGRKNKCDNFERG